MLLPQVLFAEWQRYACTFAATVGFPREDSASRYWKTGEWATRAHSKSERWLREKKRVSAFLRLFPFTFLHVDSLPLRLCVCPLGFRLSSGELYDLETQSQQRLRFLQLLSISVHGMVWPGSRAEDCWYSSALINFCDMDGRLTKVLKTPPPTDLSRDIHFASYCSTITYQIVAALRYSSKLW